MKFLFLLLFPVLVLAQSQATTAFDFTTTRATVSVSGKVDSLTNYVSKTFDLSGYDNGGFVSYPLFVGKVISSTLGTPHVFTYIQGSYDNSNWVNVDTIATNDSVETYNTTTIDLNGKYFPLYRVFVDGITGNRSDSMIKVHIYAYRKD
jgi:hypothetical protein